MFTIFSLADSADNVQQWIQVLTTPSRRRIRSSVPCFFLIHGVIHIQQEQCKISSISHNDWYLEMCWMSQLHVADQDTWSHQHAERHLQVVRCRKNQQHVNECRTYRQIVLDRHRLEYLAAGKSLCSALQTSLITLPANYPVHCISIYLLTMHSKWHVCH